MVFERHRHRFEFNNDFREPLTRAGLVTSGVSPDGRLVEIAEVANHPWMLGTQFHPEFKSRPNPAAPAVPGVRRGGQGSTRPAARPRPCPRAPLPTSSASRRRGEREARTVQQGAATWLISSHMS